MQFFHRRRQQWSEDERALALNIFYKSPATYRLFRKMQFLLPGTSTLRDWLRIFFLPTGVGTELIEKLSMKVKTMTPIDRECVLLFDEMSIKRHLQYSPRYDYIEGFEDLGHLGRTNRIGTQAVVFMIRGLMAKWKMPVAYYISSGPVKQDTLKQLLFEVVQSLCRIGLKVRATVCDQGSNNRSLLNSLGATAEEPYFMLENGHKIYTIFDTPHLIKSVRNTLLKNNIRIGENEVSFRDIEALYCLDRKNVARASTKLSEIHIRPNSFQKMKVKLATQVFSNSVATALQVAVETGDIKSDTAVFTAKFLKGMNDIFDALNSRLLYDHNPYRCAISRESKVVLNTLRQGIEWIDSWGVYTSKNKKRRDTYCFKGLYQTITAALKLWEDLEQEGYFFLLTSRLQQDPLENLFSTLRGKGGFNFNPSVTGIRTALQHNAFIGFQRPPESKNCEIDDDVPLAEAEDIKLETKTLSEAESSRQVLMPDSGSSSSELDAATSAEVEDIIKNNLSLETCAINYFSGFLLYKLKKKFNCIQCQQDLSEDADEVLCDKSQLLIVLRDYGRESSDSVSYLNVPNSQFTEVVKKVLDLLALYLEKNKHELNVCSRFKKRMLRIVTAKFPTFLSGEACDEHKIFIIDTLIRVKLNKTLQWTSKDLQLPSRGKQHSRSEDAGKPSRKLKILKHL